MKPDNPILGCKSLVGTMHMDRDAHGDISPHVPAHFRMRQAQGRGTAHTTNNNPQTPHRRKGASLKGYRTVYTDRALFFVNLLYSLQSAKVLPAASADSERIERTPGGRLPWENLMI
jgi:hypothetical protein